MFNFDKVRQELCSGAITNDQWRDLLNVIARRSGLTIDVSGGEVQYRRDLLDLPTNDGEAMAMIAGIVIAGAQHYAYEGDVDATHNRVLLSLDNGNGVILHVEFSPADRQCGLCVMPAKFMVVPALDEDDGTVAACERHLDEIAGQYSRPEIQPIYQWSK